jgi:hypothetical protein
VTVERTASSHVPVTEFPPDESPYVVPLAGPLNCSALSNLSVHPINFLFEEREHSCVDIIRRYRQKGRVVVDEDVVVLFSFLSSFLLGILLGEEQEENKEEEDEEVLVSSPYFDSSLSSSSSLLLLSSSPLKKLKEEEEEEPRTSAVTAYLAYVTWSSSSVDMDIR